MRSHLAFVLVSGFLAGCSSGEGESSATPPVKAGDSGAADVILEAAPDGGGCVAATCASKKATCGQMPDGCGGVVECGTCPAGQYCGADGPNRCGSTPCEPITCQPGDCGSISDGCSAVLSCGKCTGANSCGGGGTPNKCGCTPSTNCYSAECGSVADGCGGAVDCGSCAAGKKCVDNGCCVETTGMSCSNQCQKLLGPVKGYSQFEAVWCSSEGQSKASVTNCTGPDPDPCTTYGSPPDCGLVPGFTWCDVTCYQVYECLGTTTCDGTCQ